MYHGSLTFPIKNYKQDQPIVAIFFHIITISIDIMQPVVLVDLFGEMSALPAPRVGVDTL